MVARLFIYYGLSSVFMVKTTFKLNSVENKYYFNCFLELVQTQKLHKVCKFLRFLNLKLNFIKCSISQA